MDPYAGKEEMSQLGAATAAAPHAQGSGIVSVEAGKTPLNPLRETGAGGLRLYRPAQDFANLLLHGATVAGRLLAQQALEFIVDIADGQAGHESAPSDCSACIVCIASGWRRIHRETRLLRCSPVRAGVSEPSYRSQAFDRIRVARDQADQ